MRLTLDQNTKITDVADFMSKQDQNAQILAKKDGNGNTVLYTREANQLTGIKGALTQFKDNVLSKFDKDKGSVARQEISAFVRERGGQSINDLRGKADLAGGGHDAVMSLDKAIDYTGQLLGLEKPNAGQLNKVLSSLEFLTASVGNILEKEIAVVDKAPPLPPTQNKSLGGGELRLDGLGRKVTTPDLEIGGKKYVYDKLIGTGGGGTVYSYVAEDGSKLAVKIPPDNQKGSERANKNADSTRELANSSRVLAGNDNVSGFSQHVVMDNGLVALVGDIMPNGDLTSLGETLNSAYFALEDMGDIPSGMIGDLERKLVGLTLLQDASKGLAGMNETKGVSHGDMKTQNVMIDGSGVAKLIDLGESARTDSIKPTNYKFPDSPMYRSPEATQMIAKEEGRRDEVRAANSEMFSTMMDGIMKSLEFQPENFKPGVMERYQSQLQSFGKDIARDLRDFAEVRNNSDLGVEKTYDSFGLGTVGFELLVGGRASQDIEGEFAFENEATVEKWRQSGAEFIGIGGLTNKSSGNKEVDQLLNGLLRSDPKERLSAKEVSESQVMSTPGVGSDEVRELILALTSGNAEAIDTARQKLREKFGED